MTFFFRIMERMRMMAKYNSRITIGYAPDGQRMRKWFHAETKADLENQIRRFKNEAERVRNPSDITFGEYSKSWMTTYKSHCSQQTREMYANAKKKCARLDPYEIRRVTKTMCQQIINDHWNTPRSAEIVATYLKQVFKCAIADGIMASSPMTGVKLPKKQKKEKYLLTDQDMEKARNAQLNESDRLFLDILITFGLRPAEALALTPADFDQKNGVLHVTKAVEMGNDGSAKIKSTKTGISRDIPLPAGFRNPPKTTFYLFTRKDGQLVNKSAYRRMSERILKAVDVPGITLYAFRHRRATDLYYLTQNGTISTKQAAALMGHSEEIFIKTYSHIDTSKEDLLKIYG